MRGTELLGKMELVNAAFVQAAADRMSLSQVQP